MPKKGTLRERRMYKGRGDENTAASDSDSEPVAGHSNSIREEGDESLLGDISEMSDAEREIVSSYLRIQRKDRPKQVFCSI